MIDTGNLEGRFRISVIVCAAISASQAVLLVVAWLLAEPDVPGAPGSGSVGLPMLAAFGVLALSPLVIVPLLRNVASKTVRTNPHVDVAGTLFTWSIVEYAVWELPSLLGFVAFVVGAGWLHYLALVGVAVAGFASSFPRWDRWVERAEQLVTTAGQGNPVTYR